MARARRIYLDYGAATPTDKEVKKAMEKWQSFYFHNPSALYKEAEDSRDRLENARESIARFVGVKKEEIIFVSSSTEANNLAILGFAQSYIKEKGSPGQIITTKIEHPSIAEPVNLLEGYGWKVIRLSVNKEGFISTKKLEESLSRDTALVTLAWANPDIGTVQPVLEISKIIRSYDKENGTKINLHVDGSQALGTLKANIPGLGVDMFTFSSSKIYGPKGVAVLVVRKGTSVEPIIHGGGQERELRSGTEDVALAVGLEKAVEILEKSKKKEVERLLRLRNVLIDKVLAIPDSVLTGPDPRDKKDLTRTPNHASFAFSGIEGEELVLRLDEEGFMVGTGSACSSGKSEVSTAVTALGVGKDYEKGSLRVTLGSESTEKDVESFVSTLEKTVEKVRDFSKA